MERMDGRGGYNLRRTFYALSLPHTSGAEKSGAVAANEQGGCRRRRREGLPFTPKLVESWRRFPEQKKDKIMPRATRLPSAVLYIHVVLIKMRWRHQAMSEGPMFLVCKWQGRSATRLVVRDKMGVKIEFHRRLPSFRSIEPA